MAGQVDPEAIPTKIEPSDVERVKAAGTIQKKYRSHRTKRQLRGFGLDPQTRWIEAVKDAQYQHLTTPRAPAKEVSTDNASTTTTTSARARWTRAAKIAHRAGADDDDSVTETSDLSDSQPESTLQRMTSEERAKRKERRAAAKDARKKTAKMMDLQYFLEMVDQKHRYGSHLRKYHAHWKILDTNQSFFYWLDHGDGLYMDMPECTREKLDAEQVRYLSREERLNYLVKIDERGLIRWVKNGELVWTKDELYKDSIKGIVRTSENVPEYKYNVPPPGADSSSDSDSSDGGEKDHDNSLTDKENEDDRFANEDFHGGAHGLARMKQVSPAVLFNHMIRSSMKRGHKWIFVADTSFHLYIGYKQSGAFQHSSFMHGSRIASAGVIKVKHGQLRSLAPLSGHYRPSVENFRTFVHSLEVEGCDMRRVNIGKSNAILIGMERYTRTKKEFQGVVGALGQTGERVLRPEKVRKEEEARRDKSQSAERERLWLEEQKRKMGKGEEEGREGIAAGLVTKLTGKLRLRGAKKERDILNPRKRPEIVER